MAHDISFMQYMRAHGNTPGPTQRPLLTGAISGLIGAIPHVLILYFSGAMQSAAEVFGLSILRAFVVAVALSVIAGMFYAWVFKRAANDRRGGWMFGLSFGFLLWVLGPVALWQAVTHRPVAIGKAAIGMFGAQVLYGFVLGLVFPWIHYHVRGRFSEVPLEKGVREPVGNLKAKERRESAE